MASNTPNALAHRARQSLSARSQEWLAEDDAGKAQRNHVEFLHGLPCTNRREKRVALGTAKKYGCDERGKEHNERCPLFKVQKALDAAKVKGQPIGPTTTAELVADLVASGPAANDPQTITGSPDDHVEAVGA